MNKSGSLGTRAETAVVRAIQPRGFPHAERRRLRGRDDHGDITGCPGLIWEVKGGDKARRASDELVATWLGETEKERRNAGEDVGILVVARRGIGYDNADRWWAIILYAVAYDLRSGDDHFVNYAAWDTADFIPVRFYLGHLCRLLVDAGYGGTS